ncbi:MAG: 3-oxoacyl-[acyl-carrier protein] reductase [Myxococcales bacterium]|jgi:3-oxoacyl-[acyl-carrier protein] reductase|nr:3-oxoacyl-[acyl-carrier protein] reductase [Myxococcales bacterium]
MSGTTSSAGSSATSSDRLLAGKVAWVTGSSRGIGRVIADHLASLGAQVAVHGTSPTSSRAFNEADSLEAVARAIADAHGVDVLPVAGDLTNEARVDEIAAEIRARFGRIDILVNCAGGDIGAQGVTGANAGKPQKNDAVNISVTDLRTVLERNLMTCILPCRAVAPEMLARKRGWIVNIGSVSGLSGREGEAIYSTAKAAVHEYTRCLAAQARPHNVHVNAVAPGGVVTPRFLASRPVDETRKVKDGTLIRYGWPEEIARVVAFLASDASSYISGQVLRVDGGEQLFPA